MFLLLRKKLVVLKKKLAVGEIGGEKFDVFAAAVDYRQTVDFPPLSGRKINVLPTH